MKLFNLPLLLLALLLPGCATNHSVIAITGTVIGVEIAQNQTTGSPSAKLGYNRAEFVVVPVTNNFVPDVLSELSYNSIFSTANSSIYQRLAVGSTAVSQAGAAVMFARDPSGTLSPQAANAVSSAFDKTAPVQADVEALKVPLGRKYSAAADKTAWDDLAKRHGYGSFALFLTDRAATAKVVNEMLSDATSRGLMP